MLDAQHECACTTKCKCGERERLVVREIRCGVQERKLYLYGHVGGWITNYGKSLWKRRPSETWNEGVNFKMSISSEKNDREPR